jgi:hypothetical protein
VQAVGLCSQCAANYVLDPDSNICVAVNWIEDGSFEDTSSVCGTSGSQTWTLEDPWRYNSRLDSPSWVTNSYNPQGTFCGCKELGCSNLVYGLSAHAGDKFASNSGDPGQILSQQVSGLTAGDSYTLTFYSTSEVGNGAAAMTVWAGEYGCVGLGEQCAHSYQVQWSSADTFLGETGDLPVCSERYGTCAFSGSAWKAFTFTFTAPSSEFYIKFIMCKWYGDWRDDQAIGGGLAIAAPCHTDSRLQFPESGASGSVPFIDSVSLTKDQELVAESKRGACSHS